MKSQSHRTRKQLPKGLVPLLLLIVFSVATFAVLLPRLPQKPLPQTKHYQGVVELWNVEVFEGGSGSRSSWLTARAAKFEQSHEGLFVHVTNLTQEQLQQKLQQGESCDLICFSRGTGCLVQGIVKAYTGSVANIRDNMLLSGTVDGQVYALPIYCGSYCLFAREYQLAPNTDMIKTALTNTYVRKVGKNTYNLQPLVCGFTASNSPLSALAMSGGHGKIIPNTAITQYAAYESFVANKTAVTLLGTQRDLYRLSKREEVGKTEKLAFCPLSGYTDLVQYLGIVAEGEKASACTSFAQFLVSEYCQQTLVDINMFSVLETTFYTQPRYLACEQGLFKAYVPNVFGNDDAVQSQRNAALSTLEM